MGTPVVAHPMDMVHDFQTCFVLHHFHLSIMGTKSTWVYEVLAEKAEGTSGHCLGSRWLSPSLFVLLSTAKRVGSWDQTCRWTIYNFSSPTPWSHSLLNLQFKEVGLRLDHILNMLTLSFYVTGIRQPTTWSCLEGCTSAAVDWVTFFAIKGNTQTHTETHTDTLVPFSHEGCLCRRIPGEGKIQVSNRWFSASKAT